MSIRKVPGQDHDIWTLSGKRFDLFTPPREFGKYRHDFNLTDIATGLSHICRWGGQVNRFYSVAQHGIACANILEKLLPEIGSFPTDDVDDIAYLPFYGLVHDATEVYIDDMQRPLKINFAEYREVEDKLSATLMPALGAPAKKPAVVKMVDSYLAVAEAWNLGLKNVFSKPMYAEFVNEARNFFETYEITTDLAVPDMSMTMAKEMFVTMFMEMKPRDIAVEKDGSIRIRGASPYTLSPGHMTREERKLKRAAVLRP